MISLKSKELEQFVLYKLNKNKDNLLLEDILQIKTINLNSITIDNKFEPIYFEDLQYFRNLENLYISNANITDEDFNYIFSLSSLKTLSLYDCTINSLNRIKNLTKLENLYISRVNYSDITEINSLSSLKTLIITGIEFDSLDWLLPLKELETLDISYSKINDCQNIKKFTSLENFFAIEVFNLNIEDVISLPKLKKLQLSSSVSKPYIKAINNKGIKLYDNSYVVGDGDYV